MHERSRPVGMSTFSAELLTDSTSSIANNTGRENCRLGRAVATAMTPAVTTSVT